MEYPIDFHNEGHRLFGVLHVPEGEKKNRIGINLLCPGIKYRVGPHRLNVKMARMLCKEGFYVLRFDPRGVGDSEGSLESGQIASLWRSVQSGRFVSDTLAANDFFIKEVGLSSLCLGGLCGGAITGILSAKEDHRVTRLLLIDLPVTVMEKSLEFSDVIVPGKFSDNLFALYLKKLADPRSLVRFLAFKSDFRAIFKLLRIQCTEWLGLSNKNGEIKPYSANFNLLLLKAFEECVRRKVKMLFILAGHSYSTGEFELEFEGPVLRKNPEARALSTIYKIEEANHSYTLSEWQVELFDKVREFMEKNGPRGDKP